MDKQNFQSIGRRLRCCCFLFSICGLLTLGACSDDKSDSSIAYDPSQPVTITDFEPKEGAMCTDMFITGNNFGTDISKIEVKIGDKAIKVVGSNGKKIYCVIPQKSGSGPVSVTVYDNDMNPTTTTFEENFTYKPKVLVSTVARNVDEYGKYSIVDGDLSVAGFDTPGPLRFNKEDGSLWVTELGNSIRRIDFDKKTVSTVITESQASFSKMQSFDFSFDYDTLFMVDDNTDSKAPNRVVIAYSLRSQNYRAAYPYAKGMCGYDIAINPLDNTKYYNTYRNGAVLKLFGKNEGTGQDEYLDGYYAHQKMFFMNAFFSGNVGITYLNIHPEGKYMLVCIKDKHLIIKSMYDPVKQIFMPATLFCGTANKSGYTDGTGTGALFNSPRQGVFVKNEEYVKAGKDDVYDFYVCDGKNHCIRKITPEGVVSLVAGRGSRNVNSSYWGYIDGDPIEDARFDTPTGIAYDESTQTFYIGEENNHDIRMLGIQ